MHDEQPASPPPLPPVEGYPHAAEIVQVAVTDAGDAALSSDALESVRLWPRLDGARVAIPIPLATAVAQLALLRDGDDLVAVVRDTAGALQLIRVDPAGHVRGRSTLGERVLSSERVAYTEVVAVGHAILARTTDHALEAFSADGRLRGRLMAEPGERFTALAARNGRAAVLVESNGSVRVRWVTDAPELRWGTTSVRIPVTPQPGVFAIAPVSARIAVANAANQEFHVYEGDELFEVQGGPATYMPPSPIVGFIDDDTVGIGGLAAPTWWRHDNGVVAGAPSAPPAAFDAASNVLAAANGMLVLARSHELGLVSPTRTKYLGWDTLATGVPLAPAGSLAIEVGSTSITWLDPTLHVTGRYTVPREPAGWAYGAPLDASHAIVQWESNGVSGISIADARAPANALPVLRTSSIDSYVVQGDLVGIVSRGELHRYRIDLAAMRSEELLPPVRIGTRSTSFQQTFDPAKAGGIVAITLGWAHDSDAQMTLTTFRIDGKKIRADKERWGSMGIIGSLPDATLIVIERAEGESRVQLRRDTEVVREWRLASNVAPLAVAADGSRIVAHDGTTLSLLEADGTTRWSRDVWGVQGGVLTDTQLLVTTSGGILALDAATGEQTARTCGFEFGLHDTPPVQPAFGVTPVCEDPIVP